LKNLFHASCLNQWRAEQMFDVIDSNTTETGMSERGHDQTYLHSTFEVTFMNETLPGDK
jgi:hypothetical protein